MTQSALRSDWPRLPLVALRIGEVLMLWLGLSHEIPGMLVCRGWECHRYILGLKPFATTVWIPRILAPSAEKSPSLAVRPPKNSLQSARQADCLIPRLHS